MIPNYYCHVCGLYGDKDNLLNLISIETDESKYHYFCDNCAEHVIAKINDIFRERAFPVVGDRLTYQMYVKRKGE